MHLNPQTQINRAIGVKYYEFTDIDVQSDGFSPFAVFWDKFETLREREIVLNVRSAVMFVCDGGKYSISPHTWFAVEDLKRQL